MFGSKKLRESEEALAALQNRLDAEFEQFQAQLGFHSLFFNRL